VDIDAQDLDETAAYKLLIGSIIPRPIAWVSTLSTEGVRNIAPISFFTCVGRKPPRISLSIQPRSDRKTLKDTFVNIRDTGEFVVNMATMAQIAAVHASAIEFQPDEDEFEMVGVEPAESTWVKPPRVKGSPVALECKLWKAMQGEDGLSHLVLGWYLRDDVHVRGRVDFGGLHPVGRLAAEYTHVNNAFVPPLDPALLADLTDGRMARLDGFGDTYAAVDDVTWSPSGSVRG
jgi:flavin reductase (DIM6/NTAB) family NADH-FMN oxidoreductase RutF